MNRESQEIYEFGGFRLNPVAVCSRARTGRDRAQAEVLDTLLYFVEHPAKRSTRARCCGHLADVVSRRTTHKVVSELRACSARRPTTIGSS